MNTSSQKPNLRSSASGFTLIELLVAMAITLFIVGGLTSITITALDSFRNSRDLLRGHQQAKTALDQIALDLESIVIDKGLDAEWLYAAANQTNAAGAPIQAFFTELIFLTSAQDRYDGDFSNPGDISCVQYSLDFKDPISSSSSSPQTFILYRKIHNPDDTFSTILGKDSLSTAVGSEPISEPSYFVCENIREMTIIFNISFTNSTGQQVIQKVPVLSTNSLGNKATSLSLKGNQLITEPVQSALINGRITSIDINLQVLNEAVVNLANITNGSQSVKEKIDANTRRFVKTIYLPQL